MFKEKYKEKPCAIRDRLLLFPLIISLSLSLLPLYSSQTHSFSSALFMASSYGGRLDTSTNLHQITTAGSSFTFPTHSFMNTSFTGLLNSSSLDDDEQLKVAAVNSADETTRRGGLSLSDRIAERTGSGVPKFKSISPPSLPLSPPPFSPSSYFAIPPGLSPAELLDSPVLLSSSNVCIHLFVVVYFYVLSCSVWMMEMKANFLNFFHFHVTRLGFLESQTLITFLYSSHCLIKFREWKRKSGLD